MSFLTLALAQWLFYANFFNRKEYLRRKILLKWLEENELPNPKIYDSCYCFMGEGIEIYLWRDRDDVSIHLDSGEIICSFAFGIQDRRNYNKIKKIIKNKIKELNVKPN